MADFEWMEGYDNFENPDDWLDWLTAQGQKYEDDQELEYEIHEYYIKYGHPVLLMNSDGNFLSTRCPRCYKRYLILAFMEQTKKYYWSCYACNSDNNKPTPGSTLEFSENQILRNLCPKCKSPLITKLGESGAYLKCSNENSKRCKHTESINI